MIAFAIVLVIIGAVLLAIASPRKGGNLEIETSDIKTNLPEITGPAKIPAFILGLVFIGIGLWIGVVLFVKSTEEPAPTPSQSNITSTPVTNPTVLPTDTPIPPTKTPHPTPIPTATIDADPTVYDNFNNPANDGSFNKSQWEVWGNPPNQIIQQGGILIVTQDGKLNDETRLSARRYAHTISKKPTFFEVKMKSEPTKNAGFILFVIDYSFSAATGYAECRINDIADAYCSFIEYGSNPEKKYESEYISVDDGKFHTFRIDADPTTITFTFYMDGQVLGSYTPTKTDKYNREKAVFSPSIGVANWGWNSTAPVAGYFDDIRIGPIKE